MQNHESYSPRFAATMMDYQLTLDKALSNAALVHGEQEILSCRPDGSVDRYTFRDMASRARRLAMALLDAGLKPGDRVASLMWNNSAHLEAYFGVPMAGGILHTVNVRFRAQEISYVLNDARSRFLIVDDNLLPLWGDAAADSAIEQVFMHGYGGDATAPGEYASYDSLLSNAKDAHPPELQDERAAATLCYTGGTTGRPKGVVYSHRALIIHALAEMSSAGFGYGMNDVVLPAVPMFHVNAWGIPYSSLMAGAKLVLPGPNISGEALLRLVENEGVTFMAGVPTVWSNVLDCLKKRPADYRLDNVRVLTGGAAPHKALIEGLNERGIRMFQGWGMTETSGVVAVCHLKPESKASPERRTDFLTKQGLPLPIAQVRLVEDGATATDTGLRTVGRIEVRGTSVTGAYLHGLKPEKWTDDGWLKTGDIGSIDELGYLTVLEREEDLIKSGGEWIAPRDVEDAILEDPRVETCAVVARPDVRWGERPIAFVVLHDEAAMDWTELRSALEDQFPRYWVPDAFITVAELPYTSVGKIDRKLLKENFGSHPVSAQAERDENKIGGV